ncbi:MAG: apolipoprotein N-acyltransferase [Pseudomonadota bacterium]
MKLRLAVSTVLGAFLPLAFAPYEQWWLIPVLVAGWIGCWWDLPTRRAWWVGFAFGASAFTAGTYWLYHSIVTIGNAPWALAIFLVFGMVAIMALYFGFSAALSVRIAGGRRASTLIVLPGAFVLFEWMRGWVLSGFPWLTLGYALPETALAGWLPVGGVYLGSFVLVVLGSALRAVFSGGIRRRVGAITLVLVAGLSIALTDRQYARAEPEQVTAALAQLGLDQKLKWDEAQFQSTLQWYGSFVRDHAGADLLLTPEVAIPTVADRVPGYLDQLENLAAAGDSTLLVGILARDPGESPSNVLLQLGDTPRQQYAKRHLVPFGEFFPVPGFIREWMRLQGLPFSDLKRGDASPIPLQVGGLPIATSICYEDAYASEQLTFFPEARFIVNVTNDAWFGDTIAPHQHLQIARARSAESQRWQFRAANTGITAIIDGRGQVVAAAPSFEPAILTGQISTVSGHTPYTRFGNVLALMIALVSISIGMNVSRRSSR